LYRISGFYGANISNPDFNNEYWPFFTRKMILNTYIALMKILAVCLGNICRSPLARGILEHLAGKNKLNWEIDSAGTSDWHTGEPPCDGSIGVGREHGIEIGHYRARQLNREDFHRFDLILAMDTQNYQVLEQWRTRLNSNVRIDMILNFSYPGENRAVPDSYFTGNYREVFHLLYEACEKIVEQFKDKN
jgi:protein-tyrosine phosphatase